MIARKLLNITFYVLCLFFVFLCVVRFGISLKVMWPFIKDIRFVCVIFCDAETQHWGGVNIRWAAGRQGKTDKFVLIFIRRF
jgi:hypothetical protein